MSREGRKRQFAASKPKFRRFFGVREDSPASNAQFASFDAEHRSLASKVVSDQVPEEHVRDKKDHAKNIEREAGFSRGRRPVVAGSRG
jgi:hypothetical protein